jgi:hypothetical protein
VQEEFTQLCYYHGPIDGIAGSENRTCDTLAPVRGGLRWFDWPEGLILEVPIRHPDHPWFEELRLKWFALPAVSGMLLQIGGVKYPAAPFSGWYVGTEVGARDLADIQRYNVLPTVYFAILMQRTTDCLWSPSSSCRKPIGSHLCQSNIGPIHHF